MSLTAQIPGVTPQELPDSIPSVREEMRQLSSMSFDDLIDNLIHTVVQFGINLAIAIIVFYVGKFIINRIHRLVRNVLLRRQVDSSLSTFILSFIRIVLYFILIVTVIGILGVETSSFIAIFASAGVAIGMALSGTLQNFAGGVLILLLKPYRIGDYIEAQGFAGYVKEIQMFHTLIVTYDNKAIMIPNGGLSTSSVNNWSREDYRRVQWEIAISYGDDVDVARKAILDILAADSRVVEQYIEDDREKYRQEAEEKEAEREADEQAQAEKEYSQRGALYRLFHHPRKVKRAIEEWRDKQHETLEALKPRVSRAPSVNVDSLGDSSVNLVVRAWTRSENYWALLYEYNEIFYRELPQHGVNFPFPQMDVHLTHNK